MQLIMYLYIQGAMAVFWFEISTAKYQQLLTYKISNKRLMSFSLEVLTSSIACERSLNYEVMVLKRRYSLSSRRCGWRMEPWLFQIHVWNYIFNLHKTCVERLKACFANIPCNIFNKNNIKCKLEQVLSKTAQELVSFLKTK